MRYYMLILFLLFLISCDNTSDTNSEKPEVSISTLLNDIKKYPDSMLLRETLIQQYREEGKYDKALNEVNNLIEKDSLNPELFNIKSVLQFENEDTAGTIRSMERSLQLYPDREHLVSLGTLYAETKNSQALKVADALLKNYKAKSEKDAIYIQGLYYSFLGEKEKAINYFDQALAINYTFTNAYREKAIALYDLGKYQEALQVLDKAVTVYNNFDEGYFYRGKVLEKLGRQKEAIESYERALMYDPDYVEAKEALSRLKKK